jgi:hypothetical protein
MANPVTPVTQASAQQLETEALTHGYPMRCLLALDVFANVVLFNGRLDETISSHAARASLEGKWWGIVLSKFLNLFSKDHGAGAIIGDEVRAEVIASTEEKEDVVQ